MFCSRCGAPYPQGSTSCPTCSATAATVGGAAVAMAPTQVQGRVAGHVRLVAIFWMVVGGLFMIPVLVMGVIGTVAGVAVSQAPDAPPGAALIGSGLFYLIGCMILVLASAQFATGWGLYKMRPWARTLALVLAVISLFSIPFGTALGIYTLWVLVPETSGREYSALSARG